MYWVILASEPSLLLHSSTLASQCPPAVGRALGFSVIDNLFKSETPESTKPISFCTIGDGSVHNAHFLSAFNLARHARFRRKKCPVVFGISDNGLSISYNTDGYAKHWALSNSQSGTGIPLFNANGCDMIDVYDKTMQATKYSRKHSAPSIILYEELTRRFGHAASDRQHAYLDAKVIESMAEKDVVAGGIIQAVEQWNAIRYGEVCDRFEQIGEIVKHAFNSAAEEPKITARKEMLERVAQPMVSVPSLPQHLMTSHDGILCNFSNESKKRDVMRKHMTRVIEEVMETNPKVVYIGEDVEHGGYYLVTDGLVKKYPKRVIDFPPDETTLLGAAIGFSQVGLLPIIGKSSLIDRTKLLIQSELKTNKCASIRDSLQQIFRLWCRYVL
jgi:2-oxoisovalerate dehydrogenase E1 component